MAEDISFQDLFQVEASSGRISLGRNRHVVLDADALGSLRRELAGNLGPEVARGILERIGYRCGRRDAQQLEAIYPADSPEAWVRAGLRLSRLEGIAGMHLDHVEIDRPRKKLRITGEWADSFEAEHQLRQHGKGERPVCWTLEGYASGFCSEFLGEEVLCLETACRAMGNPACTFEIRTAAQWGSAARPIHEMLTSARFGQRFDRCLRTISDMRCELEQTSLDAILTTDINGRITSCSQGAGNILGLPSSEAIGRQIGAFYRGGATEFASITGRLQKERRIRGLLTEFVTPAGVKTPVALSASAILDRFGNFNGTILVAHDLSDIRRLEDELADKDRFMANILRDSADAIFTMDANEVITSWNKGAESIFGYSAGEVIGKPVSLLVPPDLREARELESISRSFRARGFLRNYQTERLTRDGRRIQVMFTRTAIRNDEGEIIGSSSILKDVTSFRSLEKELADAEHLATIGELSAGLAHEIKNPLAGIKGAIDVIRDALPPEDMHRAILGDVIHEVDRIDKIVRDLLNYAKPKEPSLGPVDLPALAQRTIAIARSVPRRAPITIVLNQPDAVPGFTGDETQLEQVLVNLLLNAQNAMPSGGRIEVTLGYDGQSKEIRIEVKDTGPGIPEGIRAKIFQPFFTTRTGGTGLGLATSLKHVQYHGGSIEVHSEEGRGTTFIVLIPLLCHI